MHIKTRRGLDLTIPGVPRQVIGQAAPVTSVALLGSDHPGIRANLKVAVGDKVRRGQVLFVDRHRPEIAFCAPLAGKIASINRGPRRVLSTLVIDRDEDGDGDESVAFDWPETEPDRAGLRTLIQQAGLWPSFLTRPFGRIPDPQAEPTALFITAMDTEPLTADPKVVIGAHADLFEAGVALAARLTDGPVYVCQAPGEPLAGADTGQVKTVTFAGPHPAGLAGTHIHFLAPVNGSGAVWHIGYQDVIALGALRLRGEHWSERVVAIGGSGVSEPELLQTVIGADIDELLAGRLTDGRVRILSGSILSGRASRYLGRYHRQVSVLHEGLDTDHGVMGMLRPTAADTLVHGRGGPMVPLEKLDRVMPLRLLPVPLLRAIAIGDVDTAERLGCLELVEEDLALLSYACVSKIEYGPRLRACLDILEESA